MHFFYLVVVVYDELVPAAAVAVDGPEAVAARVVRDLVDVLLRVLDVLEGAVVRRQAALDISRSLNLKERVIKV